MLITTDDSLSIVIWEAISAHTNSVLQKKSAYSSGNMKDTALNGRPISPTMMCYTVSAVATLVENEHSPKNLYRNNQRNSTFELMENDLEMKQFRQIILNELSGADMRRRHGAVAFLMERFPAALPRGKFLFSDEGVLNLISSSQNIIFWPNGILITPFIWKTTHHTL